MSDLRGIGYCRSLLAAKKIRNDLRYDFYEMKHYPADLPVVQNSAQLKAMRKWPLGWCAKAVDSLADRLVFKEWKEDNFNIDQIFRMNNPDILFDSAIVAALVSGCAFVYISTDETGFPKLQVIDGRKATGILDPTTNLLKEGYAILDQDELGPKLEAYFAPGVTWFYPRGDAPYSIENSAQYPLLVPIVYRPDAKRKLGHSRISRACMGLVEGAIRTMKRFEISSEFYAFPQKYVLGLSADAEQMDRWKATISTFLQFDQDENGGHPVVGQFQQATMSPYVEQLRTFAAMFAGETGLTVDDLGFVSDNPSSAEAIKASHENLRLTARKAQRTFGACFLNVGFVAACLRDDFPYQRRQFYLTKPIWEPIFEPDAATLSSIGDGAIKLNQAVPGYFNTDNLEELTGINASEMEPVSNEPAE